MGSLLSWVGYNFQLPILNSLTYLQTHTCLTHAAIHSGCYHAVLQRLLITQFFFHLKVGPNQTDGLVSISGQGSKDEGTQTTNTFDKKRSHLNQNGNQFWPLKSWVRRLWSQDTSGSMWTTKSWSACWGDETKPSAEHAHIPCTCRKGKVTYREDVWTDASHAPLLTFHSLPHFLFSLHPLLIIPMPSSLCPQFLGEIVLQDLPASS